MFKWSYSRYSLFAKCREAYAHRYIDKLPEESNQWMTRGTEMHKQIENYLKEARHPLAVPPFAHPRIASESRFVDIKTEETLLISRDWARLEADSEDFWLKCVLDTMRYSRPDFAHVVDWKSGKPYEHHSEQAELYALAMLAGYGLMGVEVVFAYLDSGKEKLWVFGQSDIPRLKDKWNKRAAEMEAATEFYPNPQYLCRYCSYRKEAGGPCAF